MKILMFGRGAVATLYGWAFSKANHEVEYFVRPGRAAEYGELLQVNVLDCRRKAQGELVSERLQTRLRETLPEDHNFDLIIASVQHFNFKSVAEYLATRASNATVLVFNNMWDEPAVAAAPLPKEQLAWGFPSGGGGYPNGVLRGALLKKVNFGTFGTDPTAREVAVRDLFRQTGFDIAEHRDFRGWLLVHFVLNGGIHAEGLMAGSHIRLNQIASHRRNAIRTMRELLPLLHERNVDFAVHKSDLALMKLPPWVGGMILGLAWKFYKPMRFIVESHTMPNDPLFTCRDLLQYAQERGISTPRLAAAVAHARKAGHPV
ncbi:MAG: ketopantoate reductase [Acidobacteriota bacterium]|nr:ketopantoate reductase [Acidobacteriota bacterium]